MEKEEVKTYTLKKDYKKSEDFKSYYVTAALGGFKNPYDFRLAFYKDEINDVIIKREEINNNENLNENQKEEMIIKIKVPCTLECEIIMPERAVIELYKFIKKELKALNQRRLKENKKLIS
ncbi:unnamed protein product [marine sediment metagenome]|uniref:Uncharacterized protein n=1 Tax=marine sediment metagenome TaxID=412755 RepID=X1L294_9ZZZZ